MKQITSAQMEARGYAYESCADHLCLDWTDIPEERRQGHVIENQLRKLAEKRLMKALETADKEKRKLV